MLIKNLLGLIILVVWFILLIYNLIYWTNLAWRYPDKLREIAIANAKRQPNWFPFKKYSLKRAEHQTLWPARLISLFVDITLALMLLVIIFALTGIIK